MKSNQTRDSYISKQVEIAPQLLQLFNKDDKLTIFDIGACEAEDSVRYANLFSNSKIYAFEPRSDNIATAKKIIQKYNKENIILEELALSNKSGKAVFHLSAGEPKKLKNDKDWNYGNKSSSLLSPSNEIEKHHGWLKFDKKIDVTTERLDSYVKRNRIHSIDISHLDVQGAELMVLEGAGSFIENMKVIWLEVESVELYKDQPLKDDVEEFMEKNDFINVLDTVGNVSGDQLYVSRKYFPDTTIAKVSFVSKKEQKSFAKKVFNLLFRS